MRLDKIIQFFRMSAHRTVNSARSLQRPPSCGNDLDCRRLHFHRGTRHGRALWHADSAGVAAQASVGLEDSAHATLISYPRLLQIHRDRGRVAVQFADDIRGVPGTAEAHERGERMKKLLQMLIINS